MIICSEDFYFLNIMYHSENVICKLRSQRNSPIEASIASADNVNIVSQKIISELGLTYNESNSIT